MTDLPLVVITGASSGIGAATARAFAAAGHPLLLIARRLEPMVELGLENAELAAVDVTDTAAVADALARAEERFGPADLLVNNAGLMALSAVAEQDPALVQEQFDVNCVALMKNSQLVLPGMQARRRGTIVNIGSIAGKQLYTDHTVYNGTKYAVHAMTEGLRRENAAHGVRVLLVAPGMVDTGLLGNTGEGAVLDGYLDYKSSIGGGLRPGDIAQAILTAYQLPQHISFREIVVAPTSQDA
ncbi:NAD(P)-dependent oxidoreductase [Microbacterium sp. AISO3]|jgi:NADP-dependent 3-hydroxy acid dehydrogenase YdfG|uniref:NADP-dependent 3-hydroxy acid dehydrogenase YdfG n=1 Tax=Microbacterium paludicola TaxID=300019 RepID=A0ABU1I2H3_9MICO|nr:MULTISPECIES: SDR family oxidoreductase [Microbacterium]APF34743.1 oxidoreductase [Microbacterium paludicola]MDR6167836.1 NADP-dependent 3-hydroxy acid dehydrogenase YdfG [Microbacterium paludicola]OWP23578.1 NAD(P)-dependent oxidoreductase [Microbacterium sp. AISO3]POX66062.1 SDR family NAD(P)-dependent oxidoreductase [Microbacterium sp. Ru50]QCR41691.1 SDR family NAD(P)-dependent oxidoreductase [Microbacterium sp. SGAir0570]